MCGCIWTIFESIMLSWSASWMPLLSFRQNSPWCHILRWQRKCTTTTLNRTSSTCDRSERYMQNRKYFRFMLATLKDGFAVNSNSIYPASLSSTCHTVLHCSDASNTCLTKTTSAFLSTIFILWCDGDTCRCEYYCHWKGQAWQHR